MEDGEDVMEEVFDAEAESSEIALRGGRQIGMARTAAIVPHAIVPEPGREVARKPVTEVVR